MAKRKMPPALSAPRMKLPVHEESYNPPAEYLFDEEELKAWNEADPEDRELDFIPKKYSNLRKIEVYDGLVKEKFERCLVLYLCPRARRKKLNVEPDICNEQKVFLINPRILSTHVREENSKNQSCTYDSNKATVDLNFL